MKNKFNLSLLNYHKYNKNKGFINETHDFFIPFIKMRI